ncbi:MAG: hypothetical protein ACOC7L_01830 [Acidobacteriota bacterium]
MFRRTLLRALARGLVCGVLAVAAPVFATPVAPDVSADGPVVEPQNGMTVDPNG